jgi:DNA-binding response OmpR family regulator
VVVLDIGLTGEDGLSVCQYLRTHDPQIGIIFVTARGLRSDRLTGLEVGADAYLIKPVDLEELTLILRRLGQRLLTAQPPEVISAAGGWQIKEGPAFLTTPNQTRVRLSNNEYRLLKALLRQPGAPCPHAELAIALHLHPDEYHKHRVEVIFSRLRDRVLRLSGQTLPVEAERNFGYRFLPGGS